MKLRLYDFAGSPFCVKIRAILDYKRIPYERLNIVSSRYLELRRKNPTGQVPALEIDGTFVADSTDIAYRLDALQPAPPLFPEDAKLRADNHLLEDWADEALYFVGLYYRWQEPAGRRSAATIFPAPLGGLMGAAVGRGAIKRLQGQGTGRKSVAAVARDLERSLEAIEAKVADTPYLLGESPFLCDFAVMGQLVYLLRTPMGERSISRHEAIGGYLDRMKALRNQA